MSSTEDVIGGPFAWVEIPAVVGFRLLTGDGDLGTFDIPAFWIAAYAVTAEQFGAFMQAGGFMDDRWWHGLAADAFDREEPGAQRFEHAPNLPRERVTWYEAIAFCRWLSAKTGQQITLPTEWQWQVAAQGSDGRSYPWGEVYRQGYANLDETWQGREVPSGVYLEHTAPVESFPQQAEVSPFGLYHMSGNVWEWCLNAYDDVRDTSTVGSAARVVRGGSWDVDYLAARLTNRVRTLPDTRMFDIGFRVCALLG